MCLDKCPLFEECAKYDWRVCRNEYESCDYYKTKMEEVHETFAFLSDDGVFE